MHALLHPLHGSINTNVGFAYEIEAYKTNKGHAWGKWIGILCTGGKQMRGGGLATYTRPSMTFKFISVAKHIISVFDYCTPQVWRLI